MAKITRYEILNHGCEHAQYFQGCGVAFSPFKRVVTGAGMSAKEAYNDALEQVYNNEGDVADALPKCPRGGGITLRNVVPASHRGEDSEFYWYVSIRYTLDVDSKPIDDPTIALMDLGGGEGTEEGSA